LQLFLCSKKPNKNEVLSLSDKENISDAYKKFAKGLEEIEEKDEVKKKEVLKNGIMSLEQKYRDVIKETHALDARIVQLRKTAGMPELIGIGDEVKRSRFKDKDKFDQFLKNEVLEVGIEETVQTGGVLAFEDFVNVFHQARPKWDAPKKAIKQALEKLTEDGLIPKMFLLKNKKILLTFIPEELRPDLLSILYITSSEGTITLHEVTSLLGWQKERAELGLKTLTDQEIAFYDKKDKIYFIPGLRK